MTKLRKSKKHRGIRDPAKQQEVRFNKIKDKINQTPKNIDHQEIPRRMQEMMKNYKNSLIIKPKTKRKKSKLTDTAEFISQDIQQHRHSKYVKPIQSVKKEPGESSERFLGRVSLATDAVIEAIKFQDQVYTSMLGNKKGAGGMKEPFNEMTDEITLQLENARKKRLEKNRNKRKLLQKAKREAWLSQKVEQDAEDQFHVMDKVEFGEVVLRPPTLKSAKFIKIPNAKSTVMEQNRIRVINAYRALKTARAEKAKLGQQDDSNGSASMRHLV